MVDFSENELQQIAAANKVVETLRSRLLILERAPTPETPLGDVGWLRKRCDDTLYRGDEGWRCLSLVQLKKDVASFNAEFPGLLASDLLEAVVNAPEFYKPRPPR